MTTPNEDIQNSAEQLEKAQKNSQDISIIDDGSGIDWANVFDDVSEVVAKVLDGIFSD